MLSVEVKKRDNILILEDDINIILDERVYISPLSKRRTDYYKCLIGSDVQYYAFYVEEPEMTHRFYSVHKKEFEKCKSET